MAFTIRALDRATDRRGVEAIDTSFETTSVFDLVASHRAVELVERPLEQPLGKRYSIREVFARWPCHVGGRLEQRAVDRRIAEP